MAMVPMSNALGTFVHDRFLPRVVVYNHTQESRAEMTRLQRCQKLSQSLSSHPVRVVLLGTFEAGQASGSHWLQQTGVAGRQVIPLELKINRQTLLLILPKTRCGT